MTVNPWESAQLLTDAKNRPIPQLWDDGSQRFVPYTPSIVGAGSGSSGGGANLIYVSREPFSGTATVTHTFTESMDGLFISNDGAANLTFTIGTDTYTLQPDESSEDQYDAFTTVTITTTGAFRAHGRKAVNVIGAGSVGPSDVTNLAISALTSTGVTLNWTASAGASSYDIYNGFTLVGNVTTTSYTFTNLTAGSLYLLKVVAKNGAAAAPGVTINVTTPTGTTPPPADVTALAASAITATGLTLNWTASSTATSYDVYNGTTLLGNTTTPNYIVTGLTANTSYTFKVVAKNAGGSSVGATVTATTAIAAPAPVTNLTASNVGMTTLTLNWTASTGAASYDVYDGGTLLGNTAVPTFNVTGMVAGSQHTFSVIAKNASGSANATTINVTMASNVVYLAAAFNVANQNTLPMDTGPAWTVNGVWGVVSQAAEVITLPTNGSDAYAVANAGHADGTYNITAVNMGTAGRCRMIMRFSDSANYLYITDNGAGGYDLKTMVNNSAATIASSTGITRSAGDKIKAVLSGSSITVYVNGVQAMTATTTVNQTATSFGMWYNGTDAVFDDFSVTS